MEDPGGLEGDRKVLALLSDLGSSARTLRHQRYLLVQIHTKLSARGDIKPLLGEGCPVDVKDSRGRWRTGLILRFLPPSNSTEDLKVKIELEGFGSDHDTILPLSSPRIAPAGTHTFG
ncbi:hypothetical protein AAMO2058_000306300 [Amorphochlora amoebiformis]